MKQTSIKKAGLGMLLPLVVFVSSAGAADIRFVQSGDWFQTEAVDGIGWQAPGIPGELDNARANWGDNTITLSAVAPTIFRLQLGVDESGTLEINDGGVLTTVQDALAGNNNPAATGTLTVNDGGILNVGRILWAAQTGSTGFININPGGVINAANHLWWGATGAAEINISGTLTQTAGILGLGTTDAVNASGGTATVNVNDGGLLALNNIHGEGTSIQDGSLLNVVGTGQVTLPNDFVDVIYSYIDNEQIAGNGLLGRAALIVDTTTNPGFTTITAAPVVEPNDAPVLISNFIFSQETEDISFTWNSLDGELFAISYSLDLLDWSGELEESYDADAGLTTTYTVNRSSLLGANTAGAVYFRVERVAD